MRLIEKTENELLINFHLKDRLVSVEAGFENWITQEAVFDDGLIFLIAFLMHSKMIRHW